MGKSALRNMLPGRRRRARLERDRQSRGVDIGRQQAGGDLNPLPRPKVGEEQRFAAAGWIGEVDIADSEPGLRP
jgi:hypothetical protein